MTSPSITNRAPGWLLRHPRRLAMVVFLAVGVVSLLGVVGIENAETMRRHAALERDAADVAAALRQLDTEHEIYLRASAALFATHDAVTTDEFKQLQAQLNFDHFRQGSVGLGWAPRVGAGQGTPATGVLQAWMHPTYIGQAPAVQAPTRRGDTFRIVYIDPADAENAAMVGYDPYSEPVRRAAMDAAAAIAAPVATGRIGLLTDHSPAGHAGFVVYMPVFGRVAGQTPGDLRVPSQRSLRGYIFMPFRAPDLLALAIRLSAHDNLRVVAYDGHIANDRLMAWLGEPTAGPQLVEHIMIANRPWLLVVGAARPDGLSRLSQITVLSGLIVALLLALLIRMTYQKINEERQLLEWQASESGIRDSLTRELNHRVKNTLATVLSIITVTRRRETNLDSYVASLSGRIRALSATHDLLTSNDWSNVELRQIIVVELAPYIVADDDHVSLEGPDIRLAPNDSLSLGLAVHELATNAAKFGALSALTGRVAIRWERLGDRMVEIHWQETGGPEVCEPSKRGFGRELIEKILARELDSPVKLDFAPGGLQCVFRVPLRQPAPFMLRTTPPALHPAGRA